VLADRAASIAQYTASKEATGSGSYDIPTDQDRYRMIRTYFQMLVDEIAIEEAAEASRNAAILAAVLPNPQRYSAAAPSRYVRERSDWILNQMQALGGPEMLDEIDAYPNRRR